MFQKVNFISGNFGHKIDITNFLDIAHKTKFVDVFGNDQIFSRKLSQRKNA